MTEQNKKIVAFNLMKGLSMLMQSQSSLNHKLLRLVTINKTLILRQTRNRAYRTIWVIN